MKRLILILVGTFLLGTAIAGQSSPVLEIIYRWNGFNGDKFSSKTVTTFTDPSGNLVATVNGREPRIPYPKTPGTYTVTVNAPETEDHPAAQCSWTIPVVADASDYNAVMVFDPTGKHVKMTITTTVQIKAMSP